MKYRVLVKRNSLGKQEFYPQYKIFLFWMSMRTRYSESIISYNNIPSAYTDILEDHETRMGNNYKTEAAVSVVFQKRKSTDSLKSEADLPKVHTIEY